MFIDGGGGKSNDFDVNSPSVRGGLLEEWRIRAAKPRRSKVPLVAAQHPNCKLAQKPDQKLDLAARRADDKLARVNSARLPSGIKRRGKIESAPERRKWHWSIGERNNVEARLERASRLPANCREIQLPNCC